MQKMYSSMQGQYPKQGSVEGKSQLQQSSINKQEMNASENSNLQNNNKLIGTSSLQSNGGGANYYFINQNQVNQSGIINENGNNASYGQVGQAECPISSRQNIQTQIYKNNQNAQSLQNPQNQQNVCSKIYTNSASATTSNVNGQQIHGFTSQKRTNTETSASRALPNSQQGTAKKSSSQKPDLTVANTSLTGSINNKQNLNNSNKFLDLDILKKNFNNQNIPVKDKSIDSSALIKSFLKGQLSYSSQNFKHATSSSNTHTSNSTYASLNHNLGSTLQNFNNQSNNASLSQNQNQINNNQQNNIYQQSFPNQYSMQSSSKNIHQNHHHTTINQARQHNNQVYSSQEKKRFISPCISPKDYASTLDPKRPVPTSNILNKKKTPLLDKREDSLVNSVSNSVRNDNTCANNSLSGGGFQLANVVSSGHLNSQSLLWSNYNNNSQANVNSKITPQNNPNSANKLQSTATSTVLAKKKNSCGNMTALSSVNLGKTLKQSVDAIQNQSSKSKNGVNELGGMSSTHQSMSMMQHYLTSDLLESQKIRVNVASQSAAKQNQYKMQQQSQNNRKSLEPQMKKLSINDNLYSTKNNFIKYFEDISSQTKKQQSLLKKSLTPHKPLECIPNQSTSLLNKRHTLHGNV